MIKVYSNNFYWQKGRGAKLLAKLIMEDFKAKKVVMHFLWFFFLCVSLKIVFVVSYNAEFCLYCKPENAGSE